jgi:hypothetical protein
MKTLNFSARFEAVTAVFMEEYAEDDFISQKSGNNVKLARVQQNSGKMNNKDITRFKMWCWRRM